MEKHNRQPSLPKGASPKRISLGCFFFIVPGLLVPSRHYFWQRHRSEYGLPTRFTTTLKGTERQSTICSKSSLHIIILKPFTLECLKASIAIILVYSQLSANPSIEVTLVLLLCWRVSHQQYQSFRILSVLKCVFFTLNIKHNGGYGKIMEQLCAVQRSERNDVK